MAGILADLLLILALLVVAIFTWLTLAPFQTLGWWAGWFGDRIYWESPPDGPPGGEAPRNAYVVFFSGVGRATGEPLSYRELDFLQRLAAANPDATVIDDIFPYAVNNLSLTQQPWVSRIYRLSLSSKKRGVPLVGMLINLHNIIQILTAADRRYGPLFNQGVAEVIVNGLIRHGYSPEANAPILIIGYSGAGQVAVGSSLYLKEWTKAPVYVISLAGVFASDPAMLRIDHLYHLVGSKDNVEPWWFMAPGRWPFFATSEWNRALRQGRITRINMGPMRHSGAGGYLDAKSLLPDGVQFVDHTVTVVSEIIDVVQAQENAVQTAHAARLAATAQAAGDELAALPAQAPVVANAEALPAEVQQP